MNHRMFWRSAAALAWVSLCCLGSPAHAIGGYHSGGAAITSDNGAAVRFVEGGSALVQRALADLGKGNFTGIREAWCATAVSAWLSSIGKPPLANRMASSGLAYGPHVNPPRAGDLAIMKGHIGIVMEDMGSTIRIVSGNYSHKVSVAVLPRRAFIAFVRT